jgi:hypothetical protein
MKFSEYRLLSEATKDLYAAIGKGKATKLLTTKIDPEIQSLHDKTFGEGERHVEIPLENDVPEKVKTHIESHGDSVTNSGVTLKTGRSVPISKYLSHSKAPKDVSDEHENWNRNKASNSKLVISRHPGEVASCSTGTHWSSCARPSKNKDEYTPAWSSMGDEIHHGTLIAMHVHKDAVPTISGEYASKDILGRTLIKRHDSDADSPKEISFHREGKSYGAFPESAKSAVDSFTKKNYPMKNMVGHKHENLYDDDNKSVKVNLDHPDIEHAFTTGHDKEAGPHTQMRILDSARSEHHYALGASSRDQYVRANVATYSNNPDTLRAVHTHADSSRPIPEKALASNIHTPKDVFDKLKKHGNADVKLAVNSAIKTGMASHIVSNRDDLLKSLGQ